MALSDNDIDLLQAYLDGELPADECQGLWRRLSLEQELANELGRMKADLAVRQTIWAAMEPKTTEAFESKILRAAHRQAVMGMLGRGTAVAASLAACIVMGISIGWVGHERWGVPPTNNNAPVAVAPSQNPIQVVSNPTPGADGQYIVNVSDDSGKPISVSGFRTHDEALQFLHDFAGNQNRDSDSQDSPIEPAVAHF